LSSESFVGSLTGGSAGSTSTVFLAKSFESAIRKCIVSDAPILFAQPWAKWTSFRLLIGSVAHLNSSVPTAVDAKNGVKEKYELGETIVTAMSDESHSAVSERLTVVQRSVCFTAGQRERSTDLPSDVETSPSRSEDYQLLLLHAVRGCRR